KPSGAHSRPPVRPCRHTSRQLRPTPGGVTLAEILDAVGGVLSPQFSGGLDPPWRGRPSSAARRSTGLRQSLTRPTRACPGERPGHDAATPPAPIPRQLRGAGHAGTISTPAPLCPLGCPCTASLVMCSR